MEMTSLRLLHQSMRIIGSDMQQFQVTQGAAGFDCLFSTRDKPFVLALTSRGENPKFFRFSVEPGYRVKSYLGSMYSDLLAVLRIDGASGQRLEPGPFLAQLNAAIPHQASANRNPAPTEIIRLRPDIDEDRERPHFDTWIYWDPKGDRGPSEKNLHKTLLLLGREAADYSKEMNASSKWSASDTGRTWQSEQKK
nr:DUF6037 family protein [uncultured Pseudomonas sp.]